MVNDHSHVVHRSTRTCARRYAVAAASFLGLGIVLAAPADLDLNFNGSGLFALKVGIGGYVGTAEEVVQQSDNKLVLAGWGVVQDDDGADFIAIRISETGTLDSSFGVEGIARVDFAGQDDLAFSAVEQPNGKLILAGFANVSLSSYALDLALARFDVDGSLDTTFGTGGRVTLDLGGDTEFVISQVAQPDGRLVTAAGTNAGGLKRCAVVRFNANGSLDTSFGVDGSTPIDFGGMECMPKDLKRQSDGKLVLVATVGDLTTGDFAVARLTADGALDASFDGDGMLVIDFDENYDEAESIAIQADDVIVAAGYSFDVAERSPNPALVRIKADGSLDDGFGIGGRAIVDLGNGSALYAIVVQADGKLVATGFRQRSEEIDSGADLILARFSSDGTLDISFGIDGVATADFGSGSESFGSRGYSLIQQSDGKLVATGSRDDCGGIFIAARLADNSAFSGRVGLTVTRQSVDEAEGKATFVVRRTGGQSGAISVDYTTEPGSAQPGSDFVQVEDTLRWSDGDAEDKIVLVNLIDDGQSEHPEDFSLNLSSPSGGAQLAASHATTTITDGDGPGELALFTLDESYVSEGAGTITVYVTRRYGSTGRISVHFSTASGSATAASDFVLASGELTWGDGDTSAKAIEIRIIDDSVHESVERFEVRLGSATGGATVTRSRLSVFIYDNDSGSGGGSGTLELVETASTVSEGGTAVLTVVRDGAADGAASVEFTTASGSATAGSDFTSTTGTLNWADGDSASKSIAVYTTNDATAEGVETFTVTLSSPVGATLGTNTTATITIRDDDPSGDSGSGGGGKIDVLVLLGLLLLNLVRKRTMSAPTGAWQTRCAPRLRGLQQAPAALSDYLSW